MPQKLILDVDTGVDDAFALALALRCPLAEVVSVCSVFGTASMEKTTRNTLMALRVLGMEDRFRVGRGADRPMSIDPVYFPEMHGQDGLGNASSKYPEPRPQHGSPQADNTIIEAIKAHRNQCVLVCLGPLTNVARAIKRHAEVMKTVQRIVIRGGALRVPGNLTAVAEFNFASDPLAAKTVLKSGLPITLIPLDVSQRVTFSRQEIEEARDRDGSSTNKFLADASDMTSAYNLNMYGFHGMFAGDALAVAAALQPSLVRTFPIHVDVEAQGEYAYGMSVAEFRKKRARGVANCEAALEVDVDAARSFVRRHLWGLPPAAAPAPPLAGESQVAAPKPA